jgi:23S rRNA (uridine2552-2'-O)-methyltransferase
MARSKSSNRWLNEHFRDEYVKRAQSEGYRARAVYKLMEIDDKDKLIKSGMTVIDLGAAPGGWSQYAARKLDGKGRVIALDILEMEPLPGVEVLQGDFREQEVLEQLLDTLGDQKADLVMSDMAPNISGMSAVDQPRAMYLCELALALADETLKKGGDFLVKLFQGEGFDEFSKEMKQRFDKVIFRKPKASRPRSREVYALGRGYRS